MAYVTEQLLNNTSQDSVAENTNVCMFFILFFTLYILTCCQDLIPFTKFDPIDGLVQERRNSSAVAMELCLVMSIVNHDEYSWI